ncbi:hypothetical protein I302_100227 [Kwoniella bestiolae CBS 10118]|uniref:Uncharacterized protein n=1 Tax=Kwoniella bestiolae CBS 10118 TaxID=1296100 RepID=A0A1B9G4G4_9TREE|nr:hypothetical protein I302_03601 [Kwoniella bestiolae CBS 10118]OCF25925.1 hypothetical protein I302_03601 [Kwoniella bestiolae CBS 10118]
MYPQACEVVGLKSTKTGKLISVMKFNDNQKEYDAGDWEMEYDTLRQSWLPRERLDWEKRTLDPIVTDMEERLTKGLKFDVDHSFDLAFIVTDEDFRRNKYGSKLLSKLTRNSIENSRPIRLYTSANYMNLVIANIMFQGFKSLFSKAATSTPADSSLDNGSQTTRIRPVSVDYLEENPEVKQAIIDTMKSALKQSQLHSEWFKGSSEAQDMYVYSQLGTAFDKEVEGGTLACDIYVEGHMDGPVYGLMAFEKPSQKYDNGEARGRYDPKIESSLGTIPGRLDWVNHTLMPAAAELKNKLHHKPTEETHL